jgi:metal-dependent HD superfamily phosphatase/phosphodiesterase
VFKVSESDLHSFSQLRPSSTWYNCNCESTPSHSHAAQPIFVVADSATLAAEGAAVIHRQNHPIQAVALYLSILSNLHTTYYPTAQDLPALQDAIFLAAQQSPTTQNPTWNFT